MKHIIIQAGGIGSRMGNLTSAKPKSLIPIQGKPILFHLIDTNPDAIFYVICDHLSDVLIKYSKKFRPNSNIKYIITKEKGTCSGILEAASLIPEKESFIITWSDLVFLSEIKYPKLGPEDISIGVTNKECSFECRWKADNGLLREEKNFENGISGLFVVKDKSVLQDIPKFGSFTDYLESSKKSWSTFPIKNIIDVGTYSSFERYQSNNRYFNQVIIENDVVKKRAVVKEYEKLIHDEIDWYSFIRNKGFDRVPAIISETPYTMTRLNGVNPFLKEPNQELFSDIIKQIKRVHDLESSPCDVEEMREVYINKTIKRVESVVDIIPLAKQRNITINGVERVNPFFDLKKLTDEIEKVLLKTEVAFGVIHGDCTFSNIISIDNKCFFIDPRGYFGKKKYFGDPRYDWAKLYYSFFGNYDNINAKHYFVSVNENKIFFQIDENGWESYKDIFFKSIPYSRREIDLLHILIWFSLCGYVVEDYSSIIIAFYKAVEMWDGYLKEYQ
jgi:aminoglycoside phosphotransferase